MARDQRKGNLRGGEVTAALVSGLAAVIVVMLLLAVTIGRLVPVAGATSTGSVAVYDATDATLRFYNAATAATLTTNDAQIEFSGFDEETYVDGYEAPWSIVKDYVKSIDVVDDGIQPANTQRWFKDFSSLESVNVAKLDMSEASSVSLMFSGCSNLRDVSSLSGWNLASCSDASYCLSNMKSLETADISGWDLATNETNTAGMFFGDTNLKRIVVSPQTKLNDIPEHSIHGNLGQDWALEVNGTKSATFTPTKMLNEINAGQGAGAWVWAEMSESEAKALPVVEERIKDASGKYITITDANTGEPVDHVIKATFPSTIARYESFPIEITESLPGQLIPSLDDLTVLVDGVDITEGLRSGAWGAITYENGLLAISLNDAKADFGKGLVVDKKSVIAVSYKACLTAAATTGSEGNLTTAKMRYPSPISRPTEDLSETAEAHTKTVAYAICVSEVSDGTREPVQGARLTVADKSTGLFVQADGSLGESPFEFETDPAGLLTARILGQGEYLIHDVSLPATSDVLLTISADYSNDDMAIASLSATAVGNGMSQPEEGQVAVLPEQDGIVAIDQEAGLVGIRMTHPSADAPVPVDGQENAIADEEPRTGAAYIDMVVCDDTLDADPMWGRIADASTGEDIPYQMTIGLPADYETYAAYPVQIETYLADGRIALEGDGIGSVHVHIGEQDITSLLVEANRIVYNGSSLTITFPNLRELTDDAMARIVVSYSAHLTADAILGEEGNMARALLNAPATAADPTSLGTLDQATVRTTTYGIEVNKVDSISGEAVEGSGYVVMTADDDMMGFVKEDGSISYAEGEAGVFVSDENGLLSVCGLDEGSYTFHEVSRTEEYSEVAEDFTVTLSSVKSINAGSLENLLATYSGGIESLNHVGDGLAQGDEDGVRSVMMSTGIAAVQSSAESAVVMPLVGLGGVKKGFLGGALIAFGTVAAAVFVNRRRRINADRWESYSDDGSANRNRAYRQRRQPSQTSQVNHVKADYQAILDGQGDAPRRRR